MRHGATQVGRKPRHVHSTEEGVFCGITCNDGRTRAHVSSSTSEQQPEGWRFVPDTILPGYRRAPQWVPARTPTVRWGLVSWKAVGGPNNSSAQQTVQIHPKHGSGALVTRVWCACYDRETDVAEETMSAMVKLAKEIDEPHDTGHAETRSPSP